jgi:hypothetical protein
MRLKCQKAILYFEKKERQSFPLVLIVIEETSGIKAKMCSL